MQDAPSVPKQWYDDKDKRRAAMKNAAAAGANRALRRKTLSDMKRTAKRLGAK